MTPDDALKYEYHGIAEPALGALKAEVLRLRHICWQIEDLCWDKLAADGEHGDEHLEVRLNVSLHSLMIRVDPDGEIFQKPYKIQPRVLEVERLRELVKFREGEIVTLHEETVRLSRDLADYVALLDRAIKAGQEHQREVERLRSELAACDPKAVRVETGVWETDAQRWKARALAAELEAERMQSMAVAVGDDLSVHPESTWGRLTAENDRLRAELSDATKLHTHYYAELDKLRAENEQRKQDGMLLAARVMELSNASATLNGVRAILEALRTSVEQREAQLEARGKGGQQVGDFGEFVSVGPSAVSRLRWYLREFDRVLEKTP
jgi:hypothetical protein